MNRLNKINIDPDQSTIGEIVANNYQAAGVFQRFGLDFCCGGGKTISAACKENSVSKDELLKELNALNRGKPSEESSFRSWEPDALIDYIIDTHHNFVRNKIVEISTWAAKVAKVHGKTWPENVEIHRTFGELADEMLRHLADEEQTVFPLIREIYQKRLSGAPVDADQIEQLRNELQSMVDDHDGAGDAMKKIRSLSHDFTPPEEACTTYRILYQNLRDFEKDLHKHVHLENNILFKKAEKLI